MNILFINDIPFNPRYGGIERVTDVLARELQARYGYNIYYLSFQIDSGQPYAYPAKMFVLPNPDDVNNSRHFVLEIVEKFKIDIIVNQRGQFSYISDIIPSCGAKVVSVIHSQPSAWVKMTLLTLFNYRPQTLAGIIKYIIKVLLYPFVYYYSKRQMEKIYSRQYTEILNKYDALVLLSEKYKEELQELLHKDVSLYNIVGIPNPNTYQTPQWNFNKKDNIILYVGRLDKTEKAPIRLLYLWKKIYKKFPNWKLILVGDGNYMKTMRQFVGDNVLERVYFEGQQTDLVPYYEKASFVCLTSNCEGWGMALTEGMQHGCVPFTFNSYGAATDIMQDMISGCLIKPYNLRQYQARLVHLMKNDSLREEMSYQAYLKVQEFNATRVVSRWNDLFIKLIGIPMSEASL